jgi:hypothetical protein
MWTILSLVDLNQVGYYLHWGVVQLSAANGLVILLMVLVFAAAVLVPFPGSRRR